LCAVGGICYSLSVPSILEIGIMLKKTRLKNAKGQNIIEYLLVSVAVILIALAFMNTQNSPMKTAVENVLQDAVTDIDGLRSELKFGNASN
jgi:hypothetical protein